MTAERGTAMDEDGRWVDQYTLSRKTYTARIPHWCDRCGQRINPGQRYRREFSVYAGNAVMQKWHSGVDCVQGSNCRGECL